MSSLVILDRDGVINQNTKNLIRSPEEWLPIPGSLEAIARLNHAGYKVTVATNQPGISRGEFDINALNAIHAKFRQLLARVGGHVDGIFFCPHSADDNCYCRKPRPGLFETIGERFSTPLSGIPVIGDDDHAIKAALSVNALPMLVMSGKEKQTLNLQNEHFEIPCFDDLAHAVDDLLQAP